MELFGRDMIIGDFKLSDYGMILASLDSGATSTEDELGMDHETIEEYIGHNSIPVYLGAKYTSKLRPQATIIKDPSISSDMKFTEHECRDILRQLTGFQGYKNMQINPYIFDELLYFNVRITAVKYKKIAGNVTGIILDMECDSQFAWSKDFITTYNINAGEIIKIYNKSDDLYNYLLPKITITSPSSISRLEIKNLSDNNWTSIITNLSKNETITMDSKNEILTSSIANKIILNDFNMHFIRLVPDENQLQVNSNVTLTFNFKLPRKVGFICE